MRLRTPEYISALIPIDMKSIHEFLETAIARDASDVLIKSGSVPAMRVDGKLEVIGKEILSPEETEDLIRSIIDSSIRDYLLQVGPSTTKLSGEELVEKRVAMLRDMEEIDLVFTIDGLARVRANLFLQQNTVGASLRIIPLEPKTIKDLNLPPVLADWASQPQGLVIITGPTGSGKSTTVAAMIDHINAARQCHVVTIEDPIEHVFREKRSVINQREVGSDTRSYSSALRAVLRQTPDVIVIGEMRDAETMNVAITAGEVGHLVITTLHTTSAASTIDRIVKSFPADERRQVAAQLSASLLGVVSQRLVRRAQGPGRLPAVEIMTGSPTIKKLVDEMDTTELYGAIREGHHFGMNTMNQALEKLYQDKIITYDEALLHAGPNSAELRQMLRRV
jgi:twitching motility protein PilT